MPFVYRLQTQCLKIIKSQSSEQSHVLIEDPTRGIQHRLYDLEYQVAQLFDGSRTIDEVAGIAREKIGLQTDSVDIDRFAQQLFALGFVDRVDSVI